jgi:hypothetical protein
MPISRYRKFDVLDALILFAATAGGYGLIWWLGIDFSRNNRTVGEAWFTRWADHGTAVAIPCLINWTLAGLVIQLRTPRPGFWALFRQPGMAACTAATAGLACEFAWVGLAALRFGAGPFNLSRIVPPGPGFLRLYGDLVALWVAGAWLTLALAGLWRARPSWIDRLGIAVGIGWIGIRFAQSIFFILP